MKNIDIKNLKIASRYAHALIEETKDITDEVLSNLEVVSNIVFENEDFKLFFNHPIISLKDKQETIKETFEGKINPSVLNFIMILLEENRFNAFLTIVELYKKEVDELKNKQRVEIVCAVEIQEKYKKELEEKLNEKLNKEVILNYEQNKDILGGLVVKIEDKVIDLSLKTKFDNLRKN